MNYSLDQINKIIDQQNFKWCTIYDPNGLNVAYFANQNMTAQQMKEKLHEWFKDCPYLCDIHFKQSINGKMSTIQKYKKVSFKGDESGALVVHVDIDAERKKIRAELLADLKKEEEKKYLSSLKQEWEEKVAALDTMGGKVEHIFSKLLTKIMAGGAPEGNLAGSPIAQDQYTEAQVQAANEALSIFLNLVSPEELIILARKLREKPEALQTIKAFL